MDVRSGLWPHRLRESTAGAAAVALLFAVVAIACVLSGPAQAHAGPRGGALTTTGPVPPPGVLPPVLGRAAATGVGEVVLGGAPAYLWRDGCAPTSAGMLLGYYDAHGFPDLIPGDASTQTPAVDQAIASHGTGAEPRHYEDYALPKDNGGSIQPDRSQHPDGARHADDCLADLMGTSRSALGLAYGWSYTNRLGPAVRAYVASTCPSASVAFADYFIYYSGPRELTFAVFQAEIDAGRPMVLCVDSDGDGAIDHAVLGIGYRETAGYPEYACLDTWYRSVRWAPFQVEGDVQRFEVFGGTAITLAADGPSADVSAPVTTVHGADGPWSATPVTLTFSAVDEGSDVDRIEAGVDGAELAPLSGLPATLRVSGQGVHRVRYRAVDKRGNEEAVRTCTVRIDAEGPVTRARAARVRKGGRVHLRYRVDDLTPKASVRLVVRTPSGRRCAVLRPGWRRTGVPQLAPWRASLRRGVYRLWVYAVDEAGNRQAAMRSARLVIR